MQITFPKTSVRVLAGAALLSGATLFLAVGCGGGDSGGSSSGGSGGASGSSTAGGDTSTGGDTTAGGTGNTGGDTTVGGTGATGGEAGTPGAEAGAAGEGPTGPVKFPPATTFVNAASISKSANFKLLGNIGESIGGTADSRREKSTKYIFIPGVVAGTQ